VLEERQLLWAAALQHGLYDSQIRRTTNVTYYYLIHIGGGLLGYTETEIDVASCPLSREKILHSDNFVILTKKKYGSS